MQQCDISDMTVPDRSAEVIVAAWYGDAEIYRSFTVFCVCVCVCFVGHAVNELWQQISRNGLSDRDEIWHIDRGGLAVHQCQDW